MAKPQGPFYELFGSKLAKARRAANITQEALSKSLGLSRTSVVNIEKGRQPVHLHLAAKIAVTLGTSVAQLTPNLIEPVPEASVPGLKRVSEQNRPWVERVISGAALRKEPENAATVLVGETQSKRIAPTGTRKKRARSS